MLIREKVQWFFAGYRPAVHIPVFWFVGLLIFNSFQISVTSSGYIPILLGWILQGFLIFVISLMVTLAIITSALMGVLMTIYLYDLDLFPKELWKRSAREGEEYYGIVPWKTSLYLTFLYLGGSNILIVLVALTLWPVLLKRQIMGEI